MTNFDVTNPELNTSQQAQQPQSQQVAANTSNGAKKNIFSGITRDQANEWGFGDLFEKLNQDGDDVLSEAEIKNLDADGDGVVTKEEVAVLDADGDGTITEEEIAQYNTEHPDDATIETAAANSEEVTSEEVTTDDEVSTEEEISSEEELIDEEDTYIDEEITTEECDECCDDEECECNEDLNVVADEIVESISEKDSQKLLEKLEVLTKESNTPSEEKAQIIQDTIAYCHENGVEIPKELMNQVISSMDNYIDFDKYSDLRTRNEETLTDEEREYLANTREFVKNIATYGNNEDIATWVRNSEIPADAIELMFDESLDTSDANTDKQLKEKFIALKDALSVTSCNSHAEEVMEGEGTIEEKIEELKELDAYNYLNSEDMAAIGDNNGLTEEEIDQLNAPLKTEAQSLTEEITNAISENDTLAIISSLRTLSTQTNKTREEKAQIIQDTIEYCKENNIEIPDEVMSTVIKSMDKYFDFNKYERLSSKSPDELSPAEIEYLSKTQGLFREIAIHGKNSDIIKWIQNSGMSAERIESIAYDSLVMDLNNPNMDPALKDKIFGLFDDLAQITCKEIEEETIRRGGSKDEIMEDLEANGIFDNLKPDEITDIAKDAGLSQDLIDLIKETATNYYQNNQYLGGNTSGSSNTPRSGNTSGSNGTSGSGNSNYTGSTGSSYNNYSNNGYSNNNYSTNSNQNSSNPYGNNSYNTSPNSYYNYMNNTSPNSPQPQNKQAKVNSGLDGLQARYMTKYNPPAGQEQGTQATSPENSKHKHYSNPRMKAKFKEFRSITHEKKINQLDTKEFKDLVIFFANNTSLPPRFKKYIETKINNQFSRMALDKICGMYINGEPEIQEYLKKNNYINTNLLYNYYMMNKSELAKAPESIRREIEEYQNNSFHQILGEQLIT